MTVLEKSARNQLDKAVQAARRAATTGADRALRALSVEQEKKPTHLSPEQNELRRKLRVVCRRLGSWDALVRSAAYEQWHRMLFSRFLAENKLLIHPKYLTHITLDECAELARERGIDQWEVAAEFAAGMLPGIFQKDDPLLLLKFAPEDRVELQRILSGISAESFLTQDALGWTYQFWQSEEKEKVNKSERKIEGADICVVTQLFTELYMVQFLLQNTLGAWWLHLHPDSPLRKEWVYYKNQTQNDFSAFPKTAKEIKILDPACGSGHFLVEAFHMLLAMWQEEGESRENAIQGIVRDNLHGLELDPRCIQIAGFAVAMEAWKSGFPTDKYLPLPNLACVGLPIRAEKSEWLKLAAGEGMLENALGQYYDLFKNADSLGSLIQIHDEGTLVPANVLMQKLESALAKERTIGDPVAEVFGETASGVLKAVFYLRLNDYHIVVTNPPFLGYRKQNNILQQYCDNKYPNSNTDLATSFIERCNTFVKKGGIYGLVTPQNWLFLTTYKNLRSIYLNNQTFNVVARLGANAFETIGGAVVQVALITLTNTRAKEVWDFLSADLSESKSSNEKSKKLEQNFKKLCQKDQLNNPDARIGMDPNLANNEMLDNYCYSAQGIGTTDNPHYVIKFWEIDKVQGDWVYFQTANKSSCVIGGYHSLFKWGQEYFNYIKLLKSQNRIGGGWQAGRLAWNHKGFAINVTGAKNITLFSGHKFDTTIGAIIPHEEKYLEPIYYYLISPDYIENLLKIDPTLSITEGTLIKVPFDIIHWQKVANEMGPLPESYSDDPTQWLFKGSILGSEQPLHVAIARMLGYRWPEQPGGEDLLDALTDNDGIVCIPPVWGEHPAVDRLHTLLAAAYGNEWSPRKEEELLKQVGYSKAGGLEGFLRDEFFKSHCLLFHQRPFIWQVWDGIKDGFSALVNYHKFDHKTLEKLIYTYLGNWITQQKDEVRQEKPGAERKLAAAEALKGNLEKILEGEKPYDIYVRWKPLHEQAIGWEPDLNDGVRMNIRPFIEAGVLRWTPNIKWGKDRGTDPISNCSGTTERLNDRHFSLEEKRKAREGAK